MQKVTVRFRRNRVCVEEFSLLVGESDFGKVKKALSETVLEEAGGGLIVTFDLSKPVPDVIRYWMFGEKWANEDDTSWMKSPRGTKGFPWGRPPRKGETDGILLLLESPHRDEVSPDLEPFVPAAGTGQGGSGRLLHFHKEALIYFLTRELGLAFTGKRTPVIIGNPFPFAASLRTRGLAEKLRDEVWIRAMLRTRFRRDLFRRLRKYKPRIIINACTGNKDAKGSPKALTRYLIDEYLASKGIARVVRVAYSHSIQKDPSSGEVTHEALIEPYADLENAECYVVEVPHPAGWRGWQPENWFPDDGDYEEWLADRQSAP